jgi:hypothetical protein
LFISGIVLLVIGVILFVNTKQASAGVALMVVGGLCFIPGSYMSFMLFHAFRGRQGYDVDHVPDF